MVDSLRRYSQSPSSHLCLGWSEIGGSALVVQRRDVFTTHYVAASTRGSSSTIKEACPVYAKGWETVEDNSVNTGPRPAVLSDIDGSLVTAHASGKSRYGWEPVVRAYRKFAQAGIRLHLVTLNGAPFVAGICNGMDHNAAEDMLGNVHVAEGNVALIVRDGPRAEWCEIPIGSPSIGCEVDRVLVRRLLTTDFPELRVRSVGMSMMISYLVNPDNRKRLIGKIQKAIDGNNEIRTMWKVGEGGHERIIDIVPEFAADKGRGITELLAHAQRVGQPIDTRRSAWFGDSGADIKALHELTSAKRLREGTAIGFVATHAGATAEYIEAVRNSPVRSFVSKKTVAEAAVRDMLNEYDRVIELGVNIEHNDHNNAGLGGV